MVTLQPHERVSCSALYRDMAKTALRATLDRICARGLVAPPQHPDDVNGAVVADVPALLSPSTVRSTRGRPCPTVQERFDSAVPCVVLASQAFPNGIDKTRMTDYYSTSVVVPDANGVGAEYCFAVWFLVAGHALVDVLAPLCRIADHLTDALLEQRNNMARRLRLMVAQRLNRQQKRGTAAVPSRKRPAAAADAAPRKRRRRAAVSASALVVDAAPAAEAAPAAKAAPAPLWADAQLDWDADMDHVDVDMLAHFNLNESTVISAHTVPLPGTGGPSLAALQPILSPLFRAPTAPPASTAAPLAPAVSVPPSLLALATSLATPPGSPSQQLPPTSPPVVVRAPGSRERQQRAVGAPQVYTYKDSQVCAARLDADRVRVVRVKQSP